MTTSSRSILSTDHGLITILTEQLSTFSNWIISRWVIAKPEIAEHVEAIPAIIVKIFKETHTKEDGTVLKVTHTATLRWLLERDDIDTTFEIACEDLKEIFDPTDRVSCWQDPKVQFDRVQSEIATSIAFQNFNKTNNDIRPDIQMVGFEMLQKEGDRIQAKLNQNKSNKIE